MTDSIPEAETDDLSSVELVKLQSNRLRGTLHDAVASAEPRFSESDALLLKFHGAYQQDDRDQRAKRGEVRERSWQMMVRLTIPGGILTPNQYLALDALADRVGNGTLRLTTRQSIQYHGVAKGNLKPLLAGVNEVLLTTIAACGDVNRNVMAAPAPIDDPIHREVQDVARCIANELRPRTGAYYEVWLDGERVSDSRDQEPLYGETYLPRKFKTGVAIDTDNSIDIYSYDCGLVAITSGGRITGYNLVEDHVVGVVPGGNWRVEETIVESQVGQERWRPRAVPEPRPYSRIVVYGEEDQATTIWRPGWTKEAYDILLRGGDRTQRAGRDIEHRYPRRGNIPIEPSTRLMDLDCYGTPVGRPLHEPDPLEIEEVPGLQETSLRAEVGVRCEY